MTSPLGCGFKGPQKVWGFRGTLIESKQRTRNFDSENRLSRFDYCAPPAIRGFQQHRSTITRWSGVERLSLRFASPPSSLRFRGRRCPRPAVNRAIEGPSCRARRNGCPSRPWQVAWRHQEGGSGRPVEQRENASHPRAARAICPAAARFTHNLPLLRGQRPGSPPLSFLLDTGSPDLRRDNFALRLGLQVPHGRCKPTADVLGSAAKRIVVEVRVSGSG
jgi:hypothetical protein